MANGSSNAKLRQDLVNARKARRATIRRRLITWTWLAAAGLPMVHETTAESAAQEQRLAAPGHAGQTSEHPIKIVPPVARAIAVGEQNAPGAVIQTRGGILRNVFGGASTGSQGSKDKDDGRKAFPLPPPDPATVNWAGVPYHAPKPGSVAATAGNNDQPIRDANSANFGVSPRPAAPAMRPQSLVTNGLPSVSPQPSSSGAVDSPRIATVAPLPPARLQPTSPQADFSTSSSSRRTNRRQIDPLNSAELSPRDSSSQASNLPPVPTYPAVGRRELAADSAAVPPSLVEASSPSMTEPAVEPEARIAAAPPATEPSVATETAETTDTAETIDTAETTPMPVSRTQPLSPAADAKAYPEETIAGQISPLRPVETDGMDVASLESVDGDATPEATDAQESGNRNEPSDQFYGSGVAQPSDSEIPELPDEAPQPQPAEAEGIAPPSASPVESDATFESTNRSATKAIPAAGKLVVASEIPGIRVITEGPSEILIRELTQYEVRVENRGSIDATGVIVRTALPPWAEVMGHNASTGDITPVGAESDDQVEWIIESLPAGVVERLFVRIKAVKPGSFDVATNWTSLPQTHSAKVTVREPQLAVEIEGPDEIIYGKSQKYRVRVMNPGDGLASNVVFTLAPDADDAVQQPIGNIPAGKEASFEIELTARDQGELKIQGAATGDLDLAAIANKSVAVAAAKIDATLSGPPLKYQDNDAVYQLLITNTGSAISESIAAEVRIPAGFEYLGGIESARVEDERLIWHVKSLSPGESLNYEFTCKMAQTGNHHLTFQCNGSAAGRANVGLETVVEAIADLKLAVFDPPAPAAVGAEVTYEIVINNRGSKAAENVRCVAQFGHGIEPVRVDGHAGDVVTGQVLFNPIARIEAGGQIKLRIVAKADKPGDHRFRAEVRSGETVLVAEEATVFVPARTERISRSSNDPANR